ncbi:MAG: DUF4956 domain-containing protein [Dehalococcoidales bacterium]|jgi:hypothetical protein|nr:DUF4956 domain-containing protein [Dehalococcoidales bacterium]
MEKIIEFFRSLQSPMELDRALTAIGFSLLASIIVYLMYQFFYGSRYIGAGVHRTFIIGGPAITALFLGIQVSIPLSLGLLGALSFVRFRTPVKDPAEIGFILLLIATSIGAATNNYVITGILLVIVFAVLGIQWMVRNRFSLFGRGTLMISVDQTSFKELETRLNAFLKERLQGVRLESMSVLDERVSLNYQYRRKGDLNWTAFTSDLIQMANPAKIEVFVG